MNAEQQTKIVSILVVDKTEPRAAGLVSMFQKMGAQVIWVYQISGKVKVDRDQTLPPVMDLALIHVGDIGWFKSAKLRVRFERAVYYGGRGGLDPRMPADAERIWRPISTQTEGLSEQEASDLIAYASAGSTVRLLRPATSFPLLRTLGALCVGYLAVRAAEKSRAAQPLSGAVWKHLGWSSLADAERKRLVDSPIGLLTHSDEVRSPKLWMDTIIATAGTRERIQPNLDNEVREAELRGLKDSVSLEELMKNLLQHPSVPPSPEVVENAFLALTSLEQW